jgi:outer membrane protein OmpA-like peptidoglycan-associated protein
MPQPDLAPRPFALALPACLVLAAALAFSPPVRAQQPLAEASVDALVAALRGGPATKSFRRTQLPEAGSNLCGAAPAAQPAAGGLGRNLEVVPYAGDTTPGVNLSVQFTTGSDRLTPADRALLDKLAQALQSPALAQERFAVAGHTDTTGDARINLELSCARALAVRQHLGSRGVAVQRLSAYGFGSTRLLAPDDATAGVNRRVEVRRAPD